MDAAGLRALQKPLKDAYRSDPAAARVTSRAVAELDGAPLTATVEGWAGPVTAGPHRAAGGSGELACSADMLLEALAACAGVTLRSVAVAMGVELRHARVVAEGHWDARGTLGVSRETPVGLTDITLTVEMDADADDATRARLLELTERYCVIAQTLRTPPSLVLRGG